MSLLVVFSHISTALLAINAILYAKHLNSKDLVYRYFAMYLILMAINQVTNTTFFILEKNTFFLFNTYLIAQFFMLSLFYYEMFKVKKQRKYILITMYVVLLLLGVQYVWTPDLFFNYNTAGIITTSTILISYAITYFFYYIGDKELKLYLVNSGILIYLLGTILIFSIANVGLQLERKLERALWILNAFIYIVFQIVIIIQWFADLKKERKNLTKL